MWDRLFDRWDADNTLRLECFDPIETTCCDEVQVTSTGSLRFYQSDSLGTYTKLESDKNSRNVFKHVTQDIYLHYNDFGILEVSFIIIQGYS